MLKLDKLFHSKPLEKIKKKKTKNHTPHLLRADELPEADVLTLPVDARIVADCGYAPDPRPFDGADEILGNSAETETCDLFF